MARDHDWTEGILDNVSIRGAIDFARRWHRTSWAIVTLPRDLGVWTTTRDVPPDALGACLVIGRHRGISLNERLLGTRGLVPALAHECGHLFQPAGIGLCRSSVQVSRREREAWWIASILAVPLDAVHHVKLFGDSSGIVARQLELPRPLVLMRRGVAQLMGEVPSRPHDHGRLMLESATLAMQLWVARFSQQLAEG